MAAKEVAEVDLAEPGVEGRRRIEHQVGPERARLAAVRLEALERAVRGDREIQDLEPPRQAEPRRAGVQPIFKPIHIGLFGGDSPAHVHRRPKDGDAEDAVGLLDRGLAVAHAVAVGGERVAEEGLVEVGLEFELEEVAVRERVADVGGVEPRPFGGLAHEPQGDAAAAGLGIVADADQSFVIAD